MTRVRAAGAVDGDGAPGGEEDAAGGVDGNDGAGGVAVGSGEGGLD
jgi:hypothetical protein